VTDANLVLGYLNPKGLLGGRIEVDRNLAIEAIQREVATPLGIGVIEAAHAIWSTVCVNMGDAIRTITAWEGIDPNDYTFVSGGGAAGMHIIPIVAELGVKNLIIPRHAGTLSAVGGLASDIVTEFQRNYECDTGHFEFDEVNALLRTLEEQARSFLSSNGVKPEDRRLEFLVDARYHAQPWELTVPLSTTVFRETHHVDRLISDFHEFHRRLRGSREETNFIECINWKVKAVGKTKDLDFASLDTVDEISSEGTEERMAYFRELGGWVETRIYRGRELKDCIRMTSPAIIEEVETTIVVFPGHELTVSRLGNYLVTING
jgi:N-methylhydantoinase A